MHFLQLFVIGFLNFSRPPKLGKYALSLVSVFQKYCYQLVMKMATPFQARCGSIIRFPTCVVKNTLLNKCVFHIFLTMAVCTDQHAISQDYQTENVLLNQQEIPQDFLKDQQEILEEWPTKESFIRKEILKWRNISDEIYKIKKVSHRESKSGISAILTLKTKCGDEILVWAPKRLAEDLEDDSYQFVYKIGLKTSADGNEYFDYEVTHL